ncbi:MAG: hypothetical protein P4L34_01220 [Paludibacter sp.]|nr:hypothetical protein [Paludibacter sp.]
MKTKIFLAVILLGAISSCTRTSKHDYLYLNAAQLKPLGIVLNEKGVFYKNENPNWKQDNEKYPCLAFVCNNDNYVTTIHFNTTDTLKTKNGTDSLLVNKELTKNDFYPLLIGDPHGKQSLDNENLPADMKLLPVAICIAETKLVSRKDTVVVWLRPTESLKKLLPAGINMEEYLQPKPIKK